MNISAVIFAFAAIFSIFMGIYTESKFRRSVAERLRGLTIKQGRIHNVADLNLFKIHTIVIYYTSKSRSKKSEMRFLGLEEALDLLVTRDLKKLHPARN